MRTQRLIADRYSLVEPLPGSATGIGWRAQDEWSGELVAVTRVLVPGLAGHALLRARHETASEVGVVGGVHHDRLARPMDMVLDSDDFWVASELLPGMLMADELARSGAVGPEDVARWGRDVADGLAAVHGVGILHRNLHAGIVSIAEDGRATVGGFATTVVTLDGLWSGTPVHVAPELARGATPSKASDVFALGAMLYTAVEGRGPFAAATADREQLLAAVTAGAVAAPQRAGWMSDPLMQMLDTDPAKRPTAAAVADQLRQLAAGPTAGDSATPRWVTPEPSSTQVTPGVGAPAAARLDCVVPPPGPGIPESPGLASPPTATYPSARQPKHRWWVITASVLAVLALAGGLLIALRPSWTSGLPGQPAAVLAPPPPPIGDPRTADPCSLLNVGSVQQFGQATMLLDFGYPHECDIYIGTGGEGFVLLWAVFAHAEDQAAAGVAERFGDLTISREAASDNGCKRTMVLGDQTRVIVIARAYEGAAMDLCAVADAGTQTAVTAMSSGSLPRRDITGPPNALTRLDTCSLLDPAALGQVPGLDVSQRTPGFAQWLCIWGDNPAVVADPWVSVVVKRRTELSGQPVQIGGRSAQVTPDGIDNLPGTCVVELVQRSYTGASGDLRVEVLELSVSLGSQQPSDAACRSAVALAEAAAPKLPRPA